MPFKAVSRFGRKTDIEIPEEAEGIDVSEVVFSIIKKRRSVRKYLKKEINPSLLEKILESAKHAPSCGNYQPWEFIIVRNEELKKDLVEAAYNQKWMLEAPVLIIACVNMRLAGAVYGERGLKLYGLQAVAAAIENMLLTAESLDLGTCWIGAFAEIMVSRILECPEYVRPCAIITLGYPAEETLTPPKQSIDEFVHIEKFGETLHMEAIKKEKKPTYMKFR
jgi:nitroreductase